jgi:hypothetical protein
MQSSIFIHSTAIYGYLQLFTAIYRFFTAFTACMTSNLPGDDNKCCGLQVKHYKALHMAESLSLVMTMDMTIRMGQVLKKKLG